MEFALQYELYCDMGCRKSAEERIAGGKATGLYDATRDGKGMYIYHRHSQLPNSRDEQESSSLPTTSTECHQHVSPLS